MPVAMDALIDDLLAETSVLDGLVAGLDASEWGLPTPAEGWAIRDQISHLAYFDDAATLAVTDPHRFQVEAEALIATGPDAVDRLAGRYRALEPARLLTWFRAARAGLAATFAGIDPRTRVPWYGSPMSAASSITARLMETWAHGQDVADALGVTREPTDRLRHVAEIGVRALPWSFTVHGRPVPQSPVRVELTSPDGSDQWTWGSPETPDVVRGPVLDFCLVVTQRRHRDDTALSVRGPVADEWMTIAQAFAGPPGRGRSPA